MKNLFVISMCLLPVVGYADCSIKGEVKMSVGRRVYRLGTAGLFENYTYGSNSGARDLQECIEHATQDLKNGKDLSTDGTTDLEHMEVLKAYYSWTRDGLLIQGSVSKVPEK